MKIYTQLSKKEYISLSMEMYYRRPVSLFFGITGIVLLFCFFLNWNIENKPSTPLYYLLFGLFFLIINPLLFYLSIKRQISASPELTEKIIYEFTEEQIKLTGKSFTTEIPWENIKKINETNNWILIQQIQKVINFIPKSAFENNLDEFKSLIAKKGL